MYTLVQLQSMNRSQLIFNGKKYGIKVMSSHSMNDIILMYKERNLIIPTLDTIFYDPLVKANIYSFIPGLSFLSDIFSITDSELETVLKQLVPVPSFDIHTHLLSFYREEMLDLKKNKSWLSYNHHELYDMCKLGLSYRQPTKDALKVNCNFMFPDEYQIVISSNNRKLEYITSNEFVYEHLLDVLDCLDDNISKGFNANMKRNQHHEMRLTKEEIFSKYQKLDKKGNPYTYRSFLIEMIKMYVSLTSYHTSKGKKNLPSIAWELANAITSTGSFDKRDVSINLANDLITIKHCFTKGDHRKTDMGKILPTPYVKEEEELFAGMNTCTYTYKFDPSVALSIYNFICMYNLYNSKYMRCDNYKTCDY